MPRGPISSTISLEPFEIRRPLTGGSYRGRKSASLGVPAESGLRTEPLNLIRREAAEETPGRRSCEGKRRRQDHEESPARPDARPWADTFAVSPP